jgi:hypothetical protein
MDTLSFEEIREAVRNALAATVTTGTSCYVVQMYPGQVVFELWAGEKSTLYSQSYSIDKKTEVVTLGDDRAQVEEERSYVPVKTAAFSLGDATVDGEFVTRSGKIFEAGSYPDKDFSISEDELDQAVAVFSPVPNDLEHSETILSGELGDLSAVRREGTSLFGDVRIPRWLNKVIGDTPLKVSVAFDRISKRIAGNALVINPRIPDAQVVAAFNSRKEKTVMQPNLLKRVLALFTKNGVTEADVEALEREVAGEVAPVATVAQPSAEFAATKARADAAEARLKELDDRQVATAAAEFADKTIKDKRAIPAQRDSLVALFTAAATDDNAGKAVFSADGRVNSGVRMKALSDFIASIIPHTLTDEKLAGFALPCEGADTPKPPTIDSQAIFNARKGGGKDVS